MSDKTVRQLAEIVKIPLERLLEQLKEAGLSASTPDDLITEDEKMQLLAHLRKRHGKSDSDAGNSPRRVTLERRKVTEMKQASVPGSTTKTISVEVRKKKTYIKRSEVEEVEAKKVEEAPEVVVETIIEPVSTETIADASTQPEKPVAEVVSEEKTETETVSDADVTNDAVVDDDLEIEPVELVESVAKFEALKVKEEKKNKQEKSSKSKEDEEARKKTIRKRK